MHDLMISRRVWTHFNAKSMFSIVPNKVLNLLVGASVGGWLGLPLDALRIFW